MFKLDEETISKNLGDMEKFETRKNYDGCLDYLCSLPFYDYGHAFFYRNETPEKNIAHPYNKYKDIIDNCLPYIFIGDNLKIAKEILNKKTKFEKGKIFNVAFRIYNEKKLYLELDDTYASVAGTVRELTKLLQYINKNDYKYNHKEILSMFSEFVIMDYLADANQQKEIFDVYLINQIVKIMEKRVKSDDLTNNDDPLWIKQILFLSYVDIIGFIYAIRLFEIYRLYRLYSSENRKVLDEFNAVLQGKVSIDYLLNQYNINLENQQTIDSFIKMCNYYKKIISKKYGNNVINIMRKTKDNV